MKKNKWILSIIAVLSLCLIFVTPALAQSPTPQSGGSTYQGDKVVFGNTYRLQNGEIQAGNLVVIGGTAAIEEGASVNGDVVLIGGTINVDGTINGNLVAVGGVSTLGDHCVINGDIVTTSASLKKSDTAVVTGSITEQTPSLNSDNNSPWQFPWQMKQSFLSKLVAIVFESIALAVMAALIGLILPKQTQRIANTIESEPLVSGGVGLLTVVGSPILLIILVITLILIPVALIYVIAFGLAVLFGWIALGHFLGERIAKRIHVNWSEPIISSIGVLVLSLLVGTIGLIPCLGWIIGFVLCLVGLGAIVMTRFGFVETTAKPTAQVIPPTPPAPPAVSNTGETPPVN
jgi:cytoskeletal protein CcmA (bactofilin family)